MNSGSKRIAELDGLRGLAILLVISFHLVLAAPTGWTLANRVMLFGWSGVDLFFVLSGFLIGGILVDHRDSGNYFKAFYARRVFRILPIYLAIVGTYWLFYAAGGVFRHVLLDNTAPPMPWYAYFTFTNNFWLARHDTMAVFLPVSWSLAVEEQFYLTLPFIVRMFSPKRFETIVLGSIGGILSFRMLAIVFGHVIQNQAYVLPWFRADSLMVGVACAILVRNEEFERFVRTRSWVLYGALGVLATAIYAIGVQLPPADESPATAMMTYGLTVVALFYGALLLICRMYPHHLIASVLRWRVLRVFGLLSYFIYLTHETILNVVRSTATDIAGDNSKIAIWIGFFAGTVVLVIVAQLSWSFFESKMVRIGHRVRYEVPAAKVVSEVPEQQTVETPDEAEAPAA